MLEVERSTWTPVTLEDSKIIQDFPLKFSCFTKVWLISKCLLIYFWLKKGAKINVVLRMKNVATTWSKMESVFMKKCVIEADHNLVWVRNAVTQTRFLFVSRQYSKTTDYIRNEWFFNNFERFRLRCHVPRRGAWHRRRNLSKSSLPASFQSENSFFSLIKFLLRRHTPRGCILVNILLLKQLARRRRRKFGVFGAFFSPESSLA